MEINNNLSSERTFCVIPVILIYPLAIIVCFMYLRVSMYFYDSFKWQYILLTYLLAWEKKTNIFCGKVNFLWDLKKLLHLLGLKNTTLCMWCTCTRVRCTNWPFNWSRMKSERTFNFTSVRLFVRSSVSHALTSKTFRQNFLRFCMVEGMDSRTNPIGTDFWKSG